MRPPRTLTLKVRFAYLLSDCPNFHRTGSIIGMRNKFYGKDAQLVRCGSWIYNIANASNYHRILGVAK